MLMNIKSFNFNHARNAEAVELLDDEEHHSRGHQGPGGYGDDAQELHAQQGGAAAVEQAGDSILGAWRVVG